MSENAWRQSISFRSFRMHHDTNRRGSLLMPGTWSPATALTMLLFLAACGGRATTSEPPPRATAPEPPPVSEHSTALPESESSYRTVMRGDTLYSIAWETGRDYRTLAAWNQIKPPYTILPGQEVRIRPPLAKKPAQTKSTVKPPELVTKPKTKKWTPVAKPASPVVATPSPKIKDEVRAKAPAKPVKPQPKGKDAKPAPSLSSWAWPADGQILKRYSDHDSTKGLDIGGARGNPVRATAYGRVVYQGSGLRGYGQLIIIKHSNDYLSAYAHNDRIYVKEGDVVKRGQKIADMGSSGTDRVKLHFEIRRQGAPIDPLKFLPKR